MNLQALTGFMTTHHSELIITATCWATYLYTLKCGFVSDDIPGIAEYDGKRQGWEYGHIWRWVRYHLVGGNAPGRLKHKTPDGGEISIPLGKTPARHHFLSILVFNITCLVTFYALTPIIGPKLALLSVIILIVHPCTTQGVAWISGLAYPLSLFWISLTIILMQCTYKHPDMNILMISVPVFCLLQFFAIHAIFATTVMIWTVLLFLGYWQFAILGALVSGAMCFDQIHKTVSFRIEEFKKQQMAESTVFNARKFIVAMKTLWYYICHSIAPIQMGLYHVWGFHYDKDIELADWRFWLGFISFLAFGYFFFTAELPIKFGILWFVVFSIGFWNWVTAQQFVTERYIMVANLGLGIVISYLTQNYLWAYAFIVGAYLVRTWAHLPTYDNELRFYQSNHWNFSKSEVALGNLGVTYTRIGMEDTARDMWKMATLVNPDYDVPWVNIFYQLRSKGFLQINHGDFVGGMNSLKEALPYLEKALKAKVCHFPDQWKREYNELYASVTNPHIVVQEELRRLLLLREDLRNRLAKAKTEKEINDIQISVTNNESQISNLQKFMITYNFPFTDPSIANKLNADALLDKLTRS